MKISDSSIKQSGAGGQSETVSLHLKQSDCQLMGTQTGLSCSTLATNVKMAKAIWQDVDFFLIDS